MLIIQTALQTAASNTIIKTYVCVCTYKWQCIYIHLLRLLYNIFKQLISILSNYPIVSVVERACDLCHLKYNEALNVTRKSKLRGMLSLRVPSVFEKKLY